MSVDSGKDLPARGDDTASLASGWCEQILAEMEQGICFLQPVKEQPADPAVLRVVQVNAAFARQTGCRLRPGDELGQRAPELVALWQEAVESALHECRPQRSIRQSRPLGRWLELQVIPVEAAGQRALALLCRDVTRGRRQEHALRDHEHLLRALLDPETQLVWRYRGRGDGLDRAAAEWWLSLTGEPIPRPGQPEADWLAVVHPDDHTVLRSARRRLVAAGDPAHVEIRVRRIDGTWRWLNVRVVPVSVASDEVTEWVGTVSDATERKEAEAAVAWRSGALQLLSETGSRLLAHEDPAELVGPLCERLAQHLELDVILSYLADENDGQLRLHTSYGLAREEAELLEVLACGEPVCPAIDEMAHPTILDDAHADGEVPRGLVRSLGIAAYACLPMMADERLIGTLSFGRRRGGAFRGEEVSLMVAAADRLSNALHLKRVLTARQQAEEQLRDQQARLEDALRSAQAAAHAKDRFLATLSHELRTPLTPVLMVAAEAAADAGLPANVRQSFQIVRKNVELEARLIDDLLDLTRITRGKMRLERRLVDVHDVLQDAVDIVRADLVEKQIAVQTEFGAACSRVHGDPARLQQVFWNLLRNSGKFTPPAGRITLVTSNSEDGRRLQVRITDSGIGMTPEELQRVFDAFAQGDHAGARPGAHPFGGLGLGLAISQRLAEMHGGSITARSAGRGRGACFTVELETVNAAAPADRPSWRDRSVDGQEPPNGLQILLIEDHPSTRQALAMLLQRRRHQVAVAANGKEALEHLRAGSFDLVISDIGLPDIDGHALLARLREIQPGLVAIALSGWGMEEDVRRSSRAGFSRHLVKPVEVPKLEEAIVSALSGRCD